MKIKISIKSLMLMIVVLSTGASLVSAQKMKQTTAKQDIWQEVKWERWALKFSLPTDLKETTEKEEDRPIPADGNFGETRTFGRLNGPAASRLELLADLTNWKGEKIKTENQSGEVELSPAQALELDLIGDSRDMKRADSPTLEANYLEIDGLNGVFVIRNTTSGAGKTVKPNNKILVVWGTYRVFKGNVQRIMVSLEGQRTQLATMKKIISSLKFN
jgi:hypothetical protein